MQTKPVFIHISKNAGTSIAASAVDYITVAGHQSAARWVARNGHDAPIFAVVRNPYDRVYSEYRYRRRRFESGENNPHLGNLNKSFDAWVSSTFLDGEFRTKTYFEQSGVGYNASNMNDGTLIWFISQKQWLYDSTGECLADDVLRYERLEWDWACFTKKYGFAINLKHLNSSAFVSSPSSEFDKKSRDLIYEYYRDDFDTFGYLY